ncbi:MAG: tetratricopeptide repeat protein [Niabella sp.]
MKKPQYITLIAGAVLVALLLVFGRIAPKKTAKPNVAETHSPDDGHNHGTAAMSTDTLLALSKKSLSPQQLASLTALENKVDKSNTNEDKIHGLHAISAFWRDSAKNFIPYAWYSAESARLENSEKNLTFAGQLFLDRLQFEENPGIKTWMATQAKDLFESSLRLNPDNDSSKVGLGATLLFGGLSQNPMEGIAHIREVVAKDSTNIYAQLTLASASLMSGQTEKAVQRLETVIRLQPSNVQALLMLGDLYERQGDKVNAARWYTKALPHVNRSDIKTELEKRIKELNQ